MSPLDTVVDYYHRSQLHFGRKYLGNYGTHAVRISHNRIVKGPCELSELEGLRYVAKFTSIPVPKVYRTYHLNGRLYIEMEFCKGMTFDAALSRNLLTSDEQQRITQQLACYIDELRALAPPQEGLIASADSGPCCDFRVGFKPFGPFTSCDDFHALLRGRMSIENGIETFGEAAMHVHTRQYRTLFTHGDFCPRNIIVHDGRIVSIIDWQSAGWYLEYWEYTKIRYGLFPTTIMYAWFEQLAKLVTRYDTELAAERVLWEKLEHPDAEVIYFKR